MSQTIVVGVDGSETARKAADAAARIAAALGARLHVVSAYDKEVIEEVKGGGNDSWWISSSAHALDIATTEAGRLAAITSDITSDSANGKPHEALIDEATRLDAFLIVVGNRRMQGAGRVLGSVANSVAHNAPCDVYIVKTT